MSLIILARRKRMVCPTEFRLVGTYCFLLDTTTENFNQKISSCSTLGGSLVKVDSVEKNSAMLTFLQGTNIT